MRLVKVEDLRKEIEIISQNHEREVDRKDAIIQVHPACNRTRHGCSTEISRMTDYSPLTTHHSLQVWLAQHSVPHLVELVCEPVMQSRTHLMDMIRRLLENLSSNSANRRRLYPAELVHLEDRVRPLRIGLGLGL